MTINSLKKIIKYRLSYSGTKETDVLFDKYFIKNLDKFSKNELNLLINLFNNYSDIEIYEFILNKVKPSKKYNNLFKKIKDN